MGNGGLRKVGKGCKGDEEEKKKRCNDTEIKKIIWKVMVWRNEGRERKIIE